jgi:hypothetical protein
VHVFFVGGVVNMHVGKFLWTLRKTTFTYAAVHEYLRPWKWPTCQGGKNGAAAFSSDRCKSSLEAQQLKVTASEGRSMLLPFAHFVRQSLLQPHSDPKWHDHALAICHLSDAVQELEAAAKGSCDVAALRHHLQQHMELFTRCCVYGAFDWD